MSQRKLNNKKDQCLYCKSETMPTTGKDTLGFRYLKNPKTFTYVKCTNKKCARIQCKPNW